MAAPPAASVVQVDKSETKWVLVWSGAALMLLFTGLVIASYGFGTRTSTTTSPAAGTVTTSASTTTTATPIAGTSSLTVTKNPTSDMLLTELLGVAAVMMLVGFLYPRINTIKLPGGGELDLSTSTALLQQKVKDLATAQGRTDPETIQALQTQAVDELTKAVGASTADFAMTGVHPFLVDSIARKVVASASPPASPG